MMLLNRSERRELASRLRDLKQQYAVEINEELLRKYPVWLERFGEAARTHGEEDTAYHIDFLASAIETGTPEAFEEYARWTTRMMASRDIEPVLLADSLRQIPLSLASELDAEQQAVVEELIAAAAEQCTEANITTADPREELDDLQSTFLQAILSGDRRAALQVAVEALDEGMPIEDFYALVLQECMYTIGRLWETNRISVADEHLATAITQSVMAELYQRVPWHEEMRGRVVLTGVQNELHQVGAHLVADALDIRGWDVRFLGTNLPHRDVLGIIEAHEADVLGISATMLLHAGTVRDLIDHSRERFGDDLQIIVGGAAFRAREDLWQEIGADACALDVRDAVERFTKLAG
jgi:methanogenic corrinoid protein MtbC1